MIIAHGMGVCPVEYSAQELSEGIGAPVLEGMACAVGLARTLCDPRVPYQKRVLSESLL